MTVKNGDTALFEGANIRWLNFSGEVSDYNKAGKREFVVFLDDATAQRMHEDGWLIGSYMPKNADEGTEPQALIRVAVGFKVFTPRIVMIGGTSGRETELGEETCGLLDSVDIANVDLMIRAYEWEVNGKTGIKAYLKSIWVTIEEDYLELKYANLAKERAGVL